MHSEEVSQAHPSLSLSFSSYSCGYSLNDDDEDDAMDHDR